MTTTTQAIEKKMLRIGIDERSAKRLLKKHALPYLEQKIDVLECLLKDSSTRLSSPAGYLYQSIEHDYAPPLNYKSPQQREIERIRANRHIAFQRKEMHQKKIQDTASLLLRHIEREELAVASKLSKQIDDQTVSDLQLFIDQRQPEGIRSCTGYDLCSATIKSKKDDFGAALLFTFLRKDFFKEKQPHHFADLNYKNLAVELNISNADLDEILVILNNS